MKKRLSIERRQEIYEDMSAFYNDKLIKYVVEIGNHYPLKDPIYTKIDHLTRVFRSAMLFIEP